MSIARQTWAEAANARIVYAAHLEGVDPVRIITAGANIGADAATDSCLAQCPGHLGTLPRFHGIFTGQLPDPGLCRAGYRA